MNKTNVNPTFGSLFAMGATLVSPMHEAVTSKPLYKGVAAREKRSLVWPLVARIGSTFDLWRQRRAQRANLALLSDRLLDDIGLTPRQVEIELRKPFWR